MSSTREFLGSFVSRDEPSPVIGVAWMTKEELIDQDPFKGNGVRLDYPHPVTPEDLCDIAIDVFGYPCTAWEGTVWVDLSGTGMLPGEARKLWEDMIRPPDPGAETAGERGEHSRADQRRFRRTGSDGDMDVSPAVG